jgi:Ala-tRNA(Pro) deacylase
MRIAAFLAENRAPFDTVLHPPAYTAQNRAKFLHIPGRQVAKCVLLKSPTGYLLVVLPATHRVDPGTLAAEWGEPIGLATGEEVAHVFRDCEWGVVPPFGRLYGLPTLLDHSIDPDLLLVFESQAHGEAILMKCRDFERCERPRRVAFAAPRNLPVR